MDRVRVKDDIYSSSQKCADYLLSATTELGFYISSSTKELEKEISASKDLIAYLSENLTTDKDHLKNILKYIHFQLVLDDLTIRKNTRDSMINKRRVQVFKEALARRPDKKAIEKILVMIYNSKECDIQQAKSNAACIMINVFPVLDKLRVENHDFRKLTVNGISFDGSILNNSDFRKSSFQNCTFSRASMVNCNLLQADFSFYRSFDPRKVNYASVSHDLKVSFIISNECTLSLYNTKTGEFLNSLCEPPIRSVCFSSNDRCLIIGTSSPILKKYEISTGNETVYELQEEIVCLVSRQKYIAGAGGNNILIWDFESFGLLKKIRGHLAEVTCLDISDDLSFILSGSKDSTVKKRKIEDEFLCWTALDLKHTINCVSFIMKSHYVLTGTVDLVILNSKNGNQVFKLKMFCNVESLAISPSRKKVVLVDEKNQIRVISLKQKRVVKTLQVSKFRVHSIGYRSKSELFFVDSALKFIELNSFLY